MTSPSDVTTSHLILHVADTQASIDFWCGALGATLESDEEIEAPAQPYSSADREPLVG